MTQFRLISSSLNLGFIFYVVYIMYRCFVPGYPTGIISVVSLCDGFTGATIWFGGLSVLSEPVSRSTDKRSLVHIKKFEVFLLEHVRW